MKDELIPVDEQPTLPTANDADGKISAEASTAHLLSKEETREILTPFAFEIDKSLFGTKLATPWRRGIAISIDLLLIAILSGAPGELLAIVIAITAFRLGNKRRAQQMGKVKGAKRRAISRFIGAFILFIVLAETLPDIFNQSSESNEKTSEESINVAGVDLDLETTIQIAKLVAQVSSVAKKSECSDVPCWRSDFKPILSKVSALSAKNGIDDIDDAFDGLVDATNLSETDKEVLRQQLVSDFSEQRQALSLASQKDEQSKATEPAKAITGLSIPEKVEKPVYSIIEWVKALIEDLGLGFGWAAFYFTVFTAMWKGQTPGKKFMKIKVLQLDGTPLSMWDSFGRYGGYGAGIATGLLGFIQIYWDANRQAIHDQISATVVIDASDKD